MYRAVLVCVAAVCAASALAEAPAVEQSQLASAGSTGFQGTYHAATVMNDKLRVLRAKLAAAQQQALVAGGHKAGAAYGTRAVRRFRL